MPRENAYDPFGEARAQMPMPERNVKSPITQEPVELFRQTPEMRSFSAMFKRIMGLANKIQEGVFSAAGELQKRRDIFADVVGTLVNLSENAPKQKMVGLNPQTTEMDIESYNREAAQHVELEPFRAGGLMDILGKRKGLSE